MTTQAPQPVPARPHTRSSSTSSKPFAAPPPPTPAAAAGPSTSTSAAANVNINPPRHPSSVKMGTSPMSYGPMAGISFTDGGGFSFEGRPKSMKWSSNNVGSANVGGAANSYGARFYGDAFESPFNFSTSITMGEPSSFATSSAAFHLPNTSFSSSYQRRSYAAAARGVSSGNGLSSSFASMSFQPMSFGNSYSKSHVHSLMAQHRSDAELTKGYECCGQVHEGLHQLLEHVEDAHPFSDTDNVGMNMGISMTNVGHSGFSPITHAMDFDMEGVDGPIKPLDESENNHSASNSTSSLSPTLVPNYPLPPTASASKPNTPPSLSPAPVVPMSISDVLKSPPDAEVLMSNSGELGTGSGSGSAALTASTASSPTEALTTPATSAQPSPVFAAPKINPARNGFLGSTSTAPRPAAQQRRFDRAFNEVVAGTSPNNTTVKQSQPPVAVAPNVLFGSTMSGFGIPTAPQPGGNNNNNNKNAENSGESSNAANKDTGATGNNSATSTPVVPPEPALPQPSLFSMHKPWKCPNPGCNKAYRQSNGLRYHQQKGQCDFAQQDAGDLGLTIEEAEERSRPFICAVGAGCKKRYRQMNGLKYHYLNSGEHGQYGLRMLQNGTHPQPSNPTPAKRLTPNNTGSNTTPVSKLAGGEASKLSTPGTKSTTGTITPTPRTAGAPYAVPNKHAGLPPTSPSPMRNAAAGASGVAAPSNGVNQGPKGQGQGVGVGVGVGGLPKMGIFPTKPTPGINFNHSSTNGVVNGATPAKDIPNANGNGRNLNLPSQRGKDAVLFAAVPSDPMRSA